MKSIITALTVLAIASVGFSAEDGKKGEGKKGAKGDPAAQFAKLDSNSDGKVSKEEYMASPQAKKDSAKAEESFKKRDKNSDGSLSKEEFMPKAKGTK